MGESRQQLFDKLDELAPDDPQVPGIQKRINEIETWMIKKKFIKHVTNWGVFSDQSPLYPHHTGYVKFADISLVGALNGKGLNYNSDNSIHNCIMC